MTTFSRKIRRVYFDHAAATPVDTRVLRAMRPYWDKQFGNPGAIHKEGVMARKAVETARGVIAGILGIHMDEIVFTGSATESANLALTGSVRAWRAAHPGRIPHVVVGAIEHEAVLAPARRLEAEGARLAVLPIGPDGIVRTEDLVAVLSEDTVVVSVMYANNEIGTIQPIRAIAKIIRKWKKEYCNITRDHKPSGDERYPLFHTDATQAANYLDLNIPRLGVDMLTMNAAKIYGPKGVGLLALLRGTPLAPAIVGGGHEGGLRAGTENVPLIVGFAEALRITRDMNEKETARLTLLRDYAISELKKISEVQGPLKVRPLGSFLRSNLETRRTLYFGLMVNGNEVERLPNNVNFSLTEADHEFLALQLDAKGFAVATKSACNETDAETSHVLAALRKADKTNSPASGIRLSLGRSTTKKDIDALLAVLRGRETSTA